jgi:hypothetical protein
MLARALHALLVPSPTRRWRAAALPVVVMLALFASQSSSAHVDAKDAKDGCDDMSVIDAVDVDPAAAGLAAVDASVHEVVIPCALVESGALGPDCQDANFYVVNQTGTLLCRVDVAVFNVAAAAPVVEQAPAAPAAGGAAVACAAVVDVNLLVPPPPGYFERAIVVLQPGLSASDAHVSGRPRPS